MKATGLTQLRKEFFEWAYNRRGLYPGGGGGGLQAE